MEEPVIESFSYHYPPDLLAVLTETIPTLVKSKKLLLSFFRNAGVSSSILEPHAEIIKRDKNSVKMYDITSDILVAVNEQGDKGLSARRKILKAVVDFEDFDTCCYENRRNEARGLVWKVREIVNRKDAFTRMNIEREQERLKNHREKEAALLAEQKKKKECINKVKSDLSELTKDENTRRRGKDLEKVLNELFACYDILVSEAFVVTGRNSEGVVEQIDGAIEYEGHCYLVEMKWWEKTIGRNEMAVHLVNLHNRGGEVRGLFISYSQYSDAAITDCCNSLNRGIVVILARLDEIYKLLYREYDLKLWLKEKTTMALTHKEPLVTVDM